MRGVVVNETQCVGAERPTSSENCLDAECRVLVGGFDGRKRADGERRYKWRMGKWSQVGVLHYKKNFEVYNCSFSITVFKVMWQRREDPSGLL